MSQLVIFHDYCLYFIWLLRFALLLLFPRRFPFPFLLLLKVAEAGPALDDTPLRAESGNTAPGRPSTFIAFSTFIELLLASSTIPRFTPGVKRGTVDAASRRPIHVQN